MATNLPVNFHMSVTLQAFADSGMTQPIAMPAGSTAVWSSSDDTVATVAADPSDLTGLTGLVTAVSTTVGATVQPACVVTVPNQSTPINVTLDSVVLVSDQVAAISGTYGTPTHN